MKTTKFNYRKKDQVTTVESNEIVTSKTKMKFNNDFYTVLNTYFVFSSKKSRCCIDPSCAVISAQIAS